MKRFHISITSWLFILSAAVYLFTRLVGLTHFPIYFFTDEAIQSQSIADLINNHFRDSRGIFLPTYFRNGEYYNLGLSVYLQLIPYLIFGKSALVTRVTSVLVTLIAAFAVGIILRNFFKIKYWWMGVLLLSITPSWFLHSRTAFETAEFVSLYAGTICAYLFYRYKSSRYIYLTILLCALAFYTYNPAQLIVPLTAVALLISDWRYHWENRRIILPTLLLTAVIAFPYIRFNISNPDAGFAHLHRMGSYLTKDIPITEKISKYSYEYFIGLSPWYWYIPNDRDLPRHLMKDYGNIMIATLPFVLFGLARLLRNLHESSYRTILIAILISPTGAALVETSITRALIFVIPAAIVTAIGLDQLLCWLQSPGSLGSDLNGKPDSDSKNIFMPLSILFGGIIVALFLSEPINKYTLIFLVVLLAINISGLTKNFTNWLGTKILWSLSDTFIAWTAFIVLAGTNAFMLNDALKNGPLWYRDYGMSGMQYGAFQIYDVIELYREAHPDTLIVLSPNWANGADTVTHFFLDNSYNIQLGSIEGYITRRYPLDESTLFIMTPEEFETASKSDKFTDIQVEQIIPYPDGRPGFYFAHLHYVKNIDEVFAEEKAARNVLRESTIFIDGQEVKVRFSFLDTSSQEDAIALVFDSDPYSLAKTFDNNPFVIELTFSTSRTINGFSIIIGSINAQVTVTGYKAEEDEPVTYLFTGQGTIDQPRLTFDFPESLEVKKIRFEVLAMQSSETAQVHIWELELR